MCAKILPNVRFTCGRTASKTSTNLHCVWQSLCACERACEIEDIFFVFSFSLSFFEFHENDKKTRGKTKNKSALSFSFLAEKRPKKQNRINLMRIKRLDNFISENIWITFPVGRYRERAHIYIHLLRAFHLIGIVWMGTTTTRSRADRVEKNRREMKWMRVRKSFEIKSVNCPGCRLRLHVRVPGSRTLNVVVATRAIKWNRRRNRREGEKKNVIIKIDRNVKWKWEKYIDWLTWVLFAKQIFPLELSAFVCRTSNGMEISCRTWPSILSSLVLCVVCGVVGRTASGRGERKPKHDTAKSWEKKKKKKKKERKDKYKTRTTPAHTYTQMHAKICKWVY